MAERRSAAIVTIGSELVEGLRVDTNTAEIARDISRFGFRVDEAVSVGDDEAVLTRALARLVRVHALVVVTGGLGPTHDDVTREAAAAALGLSMEADPELVTFLQPFLARHKDPRSAAQVLTQAFVLDGAEVLTPTTGTAAGQLVPTPAGTLVLLPGPPREMRPMLARVLERVTPDRAEPRELGVSGMPESDVQNAAQTALETFDGIQLTVLAKPGDVRVILLDQGAGAAALDRAAQAVADELGEACYSLDGSTLAETIVREATVRGVTIAVAESCTGGMVAAALTDVPGSSAVFVGGAVAYSDPSKTRLLSVDPADLAQYGAVSREVAQSMARGALDTFRADIAASVTGIAGPEGGSAEKPVGTVWFGIATRLAGGAEAQSQVAWTGASREAIRARATSMALDLIRREVLKA
ncbi:MAG TPA: nicotinamide-nucleotide amidohydrolase family protein [Coriobacteriia bacterium]